MQRFLALLLLGFLLATTPALADETRFRTFGVGIDAGEERLAAWQVELTYDPDAVRIVGVEGGPPPWEEAPYYDPRGLEGGRILVAAFTLSPEIPPGAIRVARIHVQEMRSSRTPLQANLAAAADPDGRRIGATVRLVPEKGEQQP
jgi:hypothetical protein